MTAEPAVISVCARCGSEVGAGMTACPACGALLHAEELNVLAAAARDAEAAGDVSTALAAWREALVLLPEGSRQHQIVSQKITELGKRLPAAGSAKPNAPKSASGKVAGGLGAIGLMAWKLKALLLGLTKGTTLISMLISLGAYWTLFGWKFALGLVLSIYVHEMGHVFALRRYGFKATAPMFIPGIGALIRLQQQVVNLQEDADIGLAGPIYGMGAAAVALGIWYATRLPIFAAIAGFGAWINIFNLLPIATLDGGRAFHALNRPQRLLTAAAAGGAWYFTHDPLLILLGVICAARAFGDQPRSAGSVKSAATFVILVLALSAIATVRLLAPVP